MANEHDTVLDEARASVLAHSAQMKRSLDKGKLMEGLKSASSMLAELRTGSLSPKGYYELYMCVCDELRNLEMYLADGFVKDRQPVDVYELVQYAGNIVPRLYLLITVGRVFMRTVPGSTGDIMVDLVEMCRGVQNPLRGLFLRNYLLQCTKDVLPDISVDQPASACSSGKTGTVRDSIEFIMSNFAEMNKLWVRMQHQGHTRDVQRRELERQELRLLVGTNLLRLSHLENVNTELYKKMVLPGIMEQVVSCRDPISQEYLMECVIQVFPDEFHLATLSCLLKACGKLHPAVSVKNIIIALIDRLSVFATRADSPGIPDNIKLFDIFSQQIADIVQTRAGTLPAEHMVSLYVSLVNMVHKCYPHRLDHVDLVFQQTAELLAQQQSTKIVEHSAVGKEMLKLMRIPLNSFGQLTLLQLPHYVACLQLLNFAGRRDVCLRILEHIVDNDIVVAHQQQTDALLNLLESVMVDQPDVGDEFGEEDFIEEQDLVAKFVHQLRSEDVDEQYLMLSTARQHLSSGGRRIRHTLPPLLFSAFQLAAKFEQHKQQDENWGRKIDKLFQLCHQCIGLLVRAEQCQLALRLYLQAACTAGQLGFDNAETVAYEFISQAFTLYEEEISDSKAQMAAITLIVATVKQMWCFSEENHAPLRSQCALAAGKLLKKPDQCRAVCTCAHLFWSGLKQDKCELRDGKRVLECLKKAVRVAGQCMDVVVQCQLLVEIINCMFYFFSAGNSEISVELLNQLLEKVRQDLDNLDVGSEETGQIRSHFNNTLAHMRHTASSGGSNVNYSGLLYDQ